MRKTERLGLGVVGYIMAIILRGFANPTTLLKAVSVSFNTKFTQNI